jgi:hypothetical protein
MSSIEKIKKNIRKLQYQVSIGLKNARKYILTLIEFEELLTKLTMLVPVPVPVPVPVTIQSTPLQTPLQLDIFSVLGQSPQPVPQKQTFLLKNIQSAFEEAGGCLKRYWKPEMESLIPELINCKIRVSDPWDWWIKNTTIQKMDKLGWRDRHIFYCIGAAEILRTKTR